MTRCWRRCGFQLAIPFGIASLHASSVLVGGAITFFGDCVLAQIAPDGTLPNNSVVTPQGNTSIINGGTRAGSNLFHSFDEFSVPTGSAAYFNNALDIQNIFSRVTGEFISNIDGLIRANGTANLFLINPNGITFGPNASLNIGGSFLGSTASSLNFADGTQFSATAPQATSLLSVSVPLGLQYGGTVGGIQVRESILQVQTGQTLALVGGDVALFGGEFGFLGARGGRIELGGLAGAGMVDIEGQQSLRAFRLTSLHFPDAIERADVLLSNYAYVNVADGGGGSIAINARSLDVSGGSFLGAGIEADSGSVGSQAGDITLNATEAMTVTNSSISNDVRPAGVGNAGNLTIETGSLSIRDGADVTADTSGEGNAGNLLVQARDAVEVVGAGSFLSAAVYEGANGNGGNVTVDTGQLSVRDGALIVAGTRSSGSAGSLSVSARDSVELIGTSADGQSPSRLITSVQPEATGNGGNLTVDTGQLSVRDGAQIQADTFGSGSAGGLSVSARDSVELTGTSADGQFASTLTTSGATGDGGNLTVDTGRLILRDGAQIRADTSGFGSAGSLSVSARDSVELIGTSADGRFTSNLSTSAESEATGDGGKLTVFTGRLILRDGAEIGAATFGSGSAGSLSVSARDSVELIGTSAYNRSALGTLVGQGATGNGGNLTVDTGRLILQNGARIGADTSGSGSAGSLSVSARDSVELMGTSADGQGYSGLTTSAQPGATGNGGNLTVETGRLIVSDGAAVLATTSGQGRAGNLTVTASDSVELIGSLADGQSFSRLASKTFDAGDAGNLTIATGQLLVRGAFVSAGTRSNSEGKGGTLAVTASDSVELSGGGGLFTQTEGEGDAGDLTIATGRLNMRDRAVVSVSSEGSGNAGNLEVTADSIRLSNRATLSANTTAGQGNIFLRSGDLVLRRGSNIRTDATGTASGGNINIDSDVIAALENSDISANSANFFGGRVTINAQGIFGTEFRLKPTSDSDITATGGIPEFSGTVEINTPDVDPSQGLATLPAELVETSGLMASSCAAVGENNFIITGRGGLPPIPSDTLSAEAVLADWATLPQKAGGEEGAEGAEGASKSPPADCATCADGTSGRKRSRPASPAPPPLIVEAQGWAIDDKGEVVLTATAPNVTPHNPWIPSATCHTP